MNNDRGGLVYTTLFVHIYTLHHNIIMVNQNACHNYTNTNSQSSIDYLPSCRPLLCGLGMKLAKL